MKYILLKIGEKFYAVELYCISLSCREKKSLYLEFLNMRNSFGTKELLDLMYSEHVPWKDNSEFGFQLL